MVTGPLYIDHCAFWTLISALWPEPISIENIVCLPSDLPIELTCTRGSRVNCYWRRNRADMWKTRHYLAVCASVVGFLLSVVAVYLVIQWKLKKQDSLKESDLEMRKLSLSIRTTSEKKISFDGSQSTYDGHNNITDKTPRKMLVEIYTSEEIKRATNGFNQANLIEGNVYHSRLNGREVAIKIADRETHSNIEFELFNDTTHYHPNIMRLLGTCLSEGTEAFLVFEYAKNGSLKDWLHGGLVLKNQFIASCYCFLNWNQRLKICLDVAKGLKYMHHSMIPSYIHGNVKSRNIFLDEDFKAKLGNFGMARCSKEDAAEPDFETESCSSLSLTPSASLTPSSSLPATFTINWAKGYIAPERVHQGISSRDSDIYAYGIVLLEVLSAQTPITKGDESNSHLADKIEFILKSEKPEEALEKWIDRALGDNYSLSAALKLAKLARACTDEDPLLRPTAVEIVEKLTVLIQCSPETDKAILTESSSKPLVKSVVTRP